MKIHTSIITAGAALALTLGLATPARADDTTTTDLVTIDAPAEAPPTTTPMMPVFFVSWSCNQLVVIHGNEWTADATVNIAVNGVVTYDGPITSAPATTPLDQAGAVNAVDVTTSFGFVTNEAIPTCTKDIASPEYVDIGEPASGVYVAPTGTVLPTTGSNLTIAVIALIACIVGVACVLTARPRR